MRWAPAWWERRQRQRAELVRVEKESTETLYQLADVILRLRATTETVEDVVRAMKDERCE